MKNERHSLKERLLTVYHDADTTARTGRIVWYLLLTHWSRQRALSTTEVANLVGLTETGALQALHNLSQCPALPLVRMSSSSGYLWTMNYLPRSFRSVLPDCGNVSLSTPWSAAIITQRWVSRGLFEGERSIATQEVAVLLGKPVVLSGRFLTRLCGPGGLPAWDEWRKWHIDLSQFDRVHYPDRDTIVGG